MSFQSVSSPLLPLHLFRSNSPYRFILKQATKRSERCTLARPTTTHMEPPPRLRLKFTGRQILSESQHSDGLKQSWVLLKPQHQTVSDVVAHILHTFGLHNSCPNGLVISMDGFVLPSFESTTILKDRDLICVKRKGGKVVNVIKELEEGNALADKNIDKQSPRMNLLTHEEFVEEMKNYETEEEEEVQQHDELHAGTMSNGNATHKKRKASQKLKNIKKKKLCKLSPENGENTLQIKEVGSRLHSVEHKFFLKYIDEQHEDQTPEMPNKRPKKNRDGTVTSSSAQDEPKQPSRSAMRKGAKRQWLRCVMLAEKEKLHDKQSHESDLHGDMGSTKEDNMDTCKNQQLEEESDSSEDIVPVVIWPGKIRFAPSGKEKEVQQIGLEKEPYQWNGILSKKKGLKWGQVKQQSNPELNNQTKREKKTSRRKAQERQHIPDHNEWVQDNQSVTEWNKWGEENKSSHRWNKYKPPRRYYANNQANKKSISANDTMDFEKLLPMTDFPVPGDIIAYRLLLLLSSWCPEFSSYRVGKVLWFDPKLDKVMLALVPEYPFDSKTTIENNGSDELPNPAHYNDDGSLEIDFPSLADVRIVKRGVLNPSSVHHEVNATPISENTPPSSGTAFMCNLQLKNNQSSIAQPIALAL